jgi:hypothetical protein
LEIKDDYFIFFISCSVFCFVWCDWEEKKKKKKKIDDVYVRQAACDRAARGRWERNILAPEEDHAEIFYDALFPQGRL